MTLLQHPARAVPAVATLAALLAFSAPAHAYVDPGTGSMLLQMIGAGVAAAMFYLRGIRTFLAGLLRGRKPAETAGDDRRDAGR